MKMERVSLQNKYAGIQQYTIEKKNKTENKNKDAPRTTHSI
jgi:hypothetical protein